MQVLLPSDQLRKQFSEKSQPESYTSMFKSAAVKSAIPDPDVPCDADSSSSEYD